ncbi:hypothetical protein OPV22_013611 [Ensete ventricosum]|uniref:Uncharacterized protein n=1 Tax=Ensete ventricosum TaxID=4639 RepID=A0AAV8R8Q1_ENSVE|nr:hypothetical protein OPV22_013611 [Ensete ventricosum]
MSTESLNLEGSICARPLEVRTTGGGASRVRSLSLIRPFHDTESISPEQQETSLHQEAANASAAPAASSPPSHRPKPRATCGNPKAAAMATAPRTSRENDSASSGASPRRRRHRR